MTLPGAKALYSDREESRWEESAQGGGADVSLPAAMGAGLAYGLDSAAEPGRAIEAAPAKYIHRMTVRAGDRIVLVQVCDLMWIQSHGNLLRLHLQNASYEHRMTIKEMCGRLDPERFLRVHRSVIVNLDHVVEFDLPRYGNAFVHLRNGKALPIGRTARPVLRRGLLSQSYAAVGADEVWS